ncbi:hypothetical protein V6N13_092476 [Hibiscus sabdariffa]
MDTVEEALRYQTDSLVPPGGSEKGNGGDEGSERNAKETYASMVAKLNNAEERGKSTAMITDEEVVILEEDVIVEKDVAIPSIKFSDRVHDQEACVKGQGATTEGDVHSLAPQPLKNVYVSESNLFGPWMVVENRRRRPITSGRVESHPVQDTRINRGSRFAALEATDDVENSMHRDGALDQVGQSVEVIGNTMVGRRVSTNTVAVKNDAYATSNPEKKSKHRGHVSNQPTVLPIMEGQAATVVSHKAQIKGGTHTAIHIHEHNDKGPLQVSSRGGRRVGTMPKANLSVHSSGLKPRRNADFRHGASSNVSGFIDNMAGELDKIVEETSVGMNVENLMSEDESPWTDFPNDEEDILALPDPDGGVGVASRNVEIFGHIGQRKKMIKARLRGIDRALSVRHSDSMVALESRLKSELEEILI